MHLQQMKLRRLSMERHRESGLSLVARAGRKRAAVELLVIPLDLVEGMGRPLAKGKKRQSEIAADDEAIAKFEAEQMKPKKKADAEVKHRDEIETSQLLEIVADEVETIWQEFGADINRLNAREFFAMNIIRPLRINGVHFRDKEVRAVYCKEHK
jgi:hypothetical protein